MEPNPPSSWFTYPDNVQCKTFLRWVNYRLCRCERTVRSLQEDFRNGVNLCALLQVLSGVDVDFKEECHTRGERMHNILTALTFMSERAGINTLGWDADEVERGYLPTIQAIIYALITRFELCIGGTSPVHAKQFLLEWVKSCISQVQKIKITTIKNSFVDGMALCAIVSKYLPGKLNLSLLDRRESLTNTQLALHLAEENSVPALLDAGDLVAISQKRFDESSQQSIYEVHPPSVDEFSLVVYLSILYQVFTGQRSASLVENRGGSRRRRHSSDHEMAELRSLVSNLSAQMKSLEGDRDKALYVAKELRKLIGEQQAAQVSGQYGGLFPNSMHNNLELRSMRQEQLLVESNSAVLRGLQMLQKAELQHQTEVQKLLDKTRADATRQSETTLAACHARYEQLLMSSRQECQRLHELNARLLEQLEERDKMLHSLQQEMAVLLFPSEKNAVVNGNGVPANGTYPNSDNDTESSL